MPLMLSLRPFRLATTTGHVVVFEANVPKDVPAAVVSEAMKYGCVPVDGAEAVPFSDNGPAPRVEFAGDVRRSMIFLAVKQIVEINDVKNFNGAGHPKVDVVAARLGFDLTEKELVQVFQLYMQSVKENTTYDLHPNAPNIARVLEADGKADLTDLAKEFGVDPEDLKGLNSNTIRKRLLLKLGGTAASA